MQKYLKDIVKLILFLSLGVFFIWLSIKDLSPEQRSMILTNAKEVFQGNRWIYLLMCIGIGFFSVLFRGLRSVLMLEPMGYKVSKTHSYHAVMIGYLANLAFPRLGEIVRCTILQTHEKVPFQKTLGTVITERVLDILLAGLLFLLALGVEYDKLIRIFSETNIAEKIVGMLSGAGKYIALGTGLLVVVIIYALRKKIAKLSIYQKVVKIAKGFWEGLISVKNMKHPFLFILYSLAIWICFYLMFYVCAFAFPDMVALEHKQILLASLSCVVIGTVAFVIAQGGLGAYPLLVSMVLLLYGIPEESGLAIGWVVWASESLMYLSLGLVSLLLLLFQKKRKTVKL
ncbi:MAG: flippase-like domain-containing protein [Bacteroidales bacterium]|jgi:uncharacterized protein (TIRG00374 family)|nr:flippase-like domain-containing protein [Bacteroidales bacterium]